MSCACSEFRARTAQNPSSIMIESGVIVCGGKVRFPVGRENAPAGPEKFAIGNVIRGAS
jgi:hypothetical protein